ncbi:MAG: hypothetical protein H8Z69_05690 [Nanohaloarchaea archaeon]|nr:hypothetical protein [Candidatus Nanohaloarchaea archaeon]
MSVAAKVELYVSKRPYIKEALAEGLVNYSALGRKISKEKDVESLEAVKAALSRYEDHVSEVREERRGEVVEVLSETDLEIKTGVKVVKAEAKNAIINAETKNGHTSVLSGSGMALISLESPEKLEETPGVLEFILSSLAAEGINVDHLISCREDTHLVVEGSQASEALEVLRQRIR